MDDTQTSRVSDAAATRKRRSSILKSQRPPRTPFSELEFNVATPTDTAKSRRVSFSRRTGVAEFATNEATTTWKNFYEEHNRSLESSANDCASKQIGHIGKRIFDQQFEVVEADVDVHNPGHMNKSITLNTFNNQLLSLDRTEELKLSGNHSIMNLSTFTNTNTNLFGEPAMPGGEVTDRIDINFSSVQTIGNDDLDDIEFDLKQNFQGAFKRQNTSEYIQVDLDVTQAALCNDDMSITDTVHSPEVHMPLNVGHSDGNLKLGQSDDLDEIQRDLNKKYGLEMSMSQSINSLKALDPRTKLIDGNSELDKENIAVNPYAPLRETENFAVNEEVDKVLVFDGKRLTLQADKAQDERLPPKPIENVQRKTIVLNFDDDLPNFVDVPTTGMIAVTQLKKNLVLGDMSITEPVLDTNKRSFIFDEDQGNITITQAVATNIVSEDKRRTIHFDNSEGNISMTQAVPTKIAEKRRTIVYDDEEGDMSITRALPANFLSTFVQNEKPQPIVFNDGNMSMTQAIPSNIILEKDILNIPSNEAQKQKTEKCRTIFYEDNNCNFTMAQAIPSNYSIASKQSERRRTVVFEADTGNISVTQAVPSVIIQEKVQEAKIETIDSQSEKVRRRTIVYDNDTGDLSITQSVPNHILKTNLVQGYGSQKCLSSEGANNEVKNAASSDNNNKRKTIVFDNDDADISMTQAVSHNQVLCAMRDKNKDQTTKSEGASNEVTNSANSDTNKRRTIVFDYDDAGISMTQAVSLNQVLCTMRDEKKDQTTKSEGASNEITNSVNSDTNKRKTIVFNNDDADISITQAVSLNQVLCAMRDENKDHTTKSEGAINEVTNTAKSDATKRKTIVFDNDDADISMTQAVSVNKVLCAMRDENKHQITNTVNENCPEPEVKESFILDDVYADISITPAVPTNVIECFNFSINDITNKTTNSINCDKRRTVVFAHDEDDISMTQAVNTNIIVQHPNACNGQDGRNAEEEIGLETLHEALHNKKSKGHRTIVYEKEDENLSVSLDLQSEMEHSPTTSMKGNIQEQKNTVFNYVSASADSLAEMRASIHNDDENKQSNDQDTSEILNVPMMYTKNPENNGNAETEKRFDMCIKNEIKKVIRKTLSPVVPMSSGLNFSSLTRIQNDLEESIRNEMSKVITENYNEAVVFQRDTHHEPLLTDKDDSKSPNLEATFDENISSSSIADNDDELNQIQIVSAEMHSSVMNNIESQNESKSPRNIPNDNTSDSQDSEKTSVRSKSFSQDSEKSSVRSKSVSQDSEKTSVRSKSVSQDSEKTSIRSKSILNDLLDMSSSVDETRQDGQPKSEDNKKLDVNDSDEGGIFVITHDRKEINIQTETGDDLPQLIIEPPLPLEYKNKPIPLSQKIHNKLHNMKEVLVNSTNKRFDKIRTPILKRKSKDDRGKSTPVTIRRHLALEKKCEAELEEKQSIISKRQSIALSREDLLNNLSMAGAALKTQIEFDDEDLEDSPEHSTKSVQMSNGVVKTLQFDESTTETNLFGKLSSPLQKAAFGEISYVNDYKTNVIPHFTTVSDGIKELMDDLVKPCSDNLPFDCSLAHKAIEKVSTHSTEIQANLVTSSQVDLLGLASESTSNLNMNKLLRNSSTDTSETSSGIINEAVNRSVTHTLKSPIKPFTSEASGKYSDAEHIRQNTGILSITKRIESPSEVLVFDHYNPLNNILLCPKMLLEAHGYNPVESEDGTVSASNSVYDKNVESTENVTMQYNVSHVRHCMKQSGDSKSFALTELTSKLSLESKPSSIDRSTEMIDGKDRKSAKVNTLIAMKGNLELLEDDSSLTLVDDALAHSSNDLTIPSTQTSAMRVLYSSYKDDLLHNMDSELTSHEVIRKSKKRGRDTHKQSTDRRSINHSSIHKQAEITPKPNRKVLKLSQSPYTMKPMQEHRSENVLVKSEQSKNKVDSVNSEQCKKAGNVYMENLVTESKVKPINSVSIQESVLESINGSESMVSSLEPSQTASQSPQHSLTPSRDVDAVSSEIESSCTSSNNLRIDTNSVALTSSKVSKMDLQPDVMGNVNREDERGVNVVAMIEKLPFIGKECEWESRADDMWSFRLLHGRIRLMMRLEHRYDARWRVAADTAVHHINVERLHHDSKNILATVCVRFAADTMQWFVNRGCSSASEVPTLVRQCAAASRLAARWGRFMSEARHHLAYTLTPQGLVTLKVANIPLRCVWEVTLQLRLSHTSGSVAPWVEASDVTVRRIMTCAPLRSNDDPAPLLRDLPNDWSHAPRAIWKIFKYLKRMTREEDDELFRA